MSTTNQKHKSNAGSSMCGKSFERNFCKGNTTIKRIKPGDLVRFKKHRIAYLPADTRWLANNDMIGLATGLKRVWGRGGLNDFPLAVSVLYQKQLHWIYEADLEVLNEIY